MRTIDLSPLYRNSVGFDRFASLIEGALRTENTSAGYPPYNIEAFNENHYAITLAIAGINESDIEIEVERGVLSVRANKTENENNGHYLYQGIATRAFERKFSLADHVEVTNAKLENGLLTIDLERKIPEAMKPKRISINSGENVLHHKQKSEQAA